MTQNAETANEPKLVSGTITADKKDGHSSFAVQWNNQAVCSLSLLISDIVRLRGHWQSLGAVRKESIDFNGTELYIYFTVMLSDDIATVKDGQYVYPALVMYLSKMVPDLFQTPVGDSE